MRQKFVIIDYTKEMVVLVFIADSKSEEVVAIGQYIKYDDKNIASVAFAVKDNYQDMGIGTILVSYITLLAKNEGLQGFTADVLGENAPMLHIFEKLMKKMDYDLKKKINYGEYQIEIKFTGSDG